MKKESSLCLSKFKVDFSWDELESNYNNKMESFLNHKRSMISSNYIRLFDLDFYYLDSTLNGYHLDKENK